MRDRREQTRRYREANRLKLREQQRLYREARRPALRLKEAKRRHGSDVESVIAAMWEQQSGRCYLCGDELHADGPNGAAKTVVDHDHACCPRDSSCAWCRRGLACGRCNSLIGFAEDDVALLRRIADNLEAVAETTRSRLSSKPQQLRIS